MLIFYNLNETDGTIQPYVGEYPYVHWCGPYSTGLYRYRQFLFRDSRSTLTVRIVPEDDGSVPESCPFYIYNDVSAQPESYDGDSWGRTEDCLVRTITLRPVGGEWYQMLLVCKSDTEGEYITDISIGGTVYKFGASFHGENESLTINLGNVGFEPPAFIGRSLYDTEVYEERPDWVLLNRKFRELLSNYENLKIDAISAYFKT